ncbi:MAG: HEAT repeat domain-containing protein [Candidatus Micrarchaeota archaeon]
MPKQTHGGDDDTEAAPPPEPEKKLKLAKYGLTPDANIRDVFWQVMASYATRQDAGTPPESIYEHRFTFVKIALSLLASRGSSQYGMSPQFVARYIMMLFLDNGWEDAAASMLTEMMQRKEYWTPLIGALRHLLKTEKYRESMALLLKNIARNPESYPIALFYVPEIKSRELAKQLKNELSIFARGDTSENQINALRGLALINDDEEATKVLVSLLSNWDAEIRRAAAENLKSMKLDEQVAAAIKGRIDVETDAEIKKTLERIVMKWKK